jgi:hypothetical protein
MSKLRDICRHTRIVVFALLCACILAVVVMPMLTEPEPAGTTPGESGQRKAIIDVAASYLGTPYSSMNCSQFTSTVYAEAIGEALPADYIAQRSYGYEAPTLKRGDLLLYQDGVAIYWGNNNVIMSSHYWGYVTIINMDYLPGYLGARRIQ